MEKSRDIVTLLRVMRRKLIKYFLVNRCQGLCLLRAMLNIYDVISSEEENKIARYFLSELPDRKYDGKMVKNAYSWKPGRILPRYIWLTKQIIKERRKK